MTYARARLWLGISCVGTIVLLAAMLLVTGWHETKLPTDEVWQDDDVWGLVAFVGTFLLVMLPFDLVGGFVLPNRYRRHPIDFGQFFGRWLTGVMLQSLLYVATGIAILAVGRATGLFGVLLLLTMACLFYIALQGVLVRLMTDGVRARRPRQLSLLRRQLQQWGTNLKQLQVLRHCDPGFTGGVVGLPGKETIVIPESWLQLLSDEQLATAVLRRNIAIESKSRSRGLLLALLWVLIGFTLSTLLPSAGVRSITQLVTTCCGFTLWTFLGLLVLPSVSRKASYSIDSQLVEHGVSLRLLDSTLTALDRLQDDEPQRPSFVETIFHPVPSLANRRRIKFGAQSGAWHAARMVLFLSWSCLGLLSRAVHCNAGRPELWLMLPTD